MSFKSEKQIIKQLQCLVAKQQAQINSLLKQLQQIKSNKINHAHEEPIIYYQNHHRQNQYSQTFDDQLQHTQHNSIRDNDFLYQLENQLKSFYQFAQQQMRRQYFHDHPCNAFDDLSAFGQFFPNFISDIKDSFLAMRNQIQRLNQQQISLSKKIFEQQKTLNEIVFEYQNNIKKSQIIEQKLLKKIQSLQHNQPLTGHHHQYFYSSNQNKSFKSNSQT